VESPSSLLKERDKKGKERVFKPGAVSSFFFSSFLSPSVEGEVAETGVAVGSGLVSATAKRKNKSKMKTKEKREKVEISNAKRNKRKIGKIVKNMCRGELKLLKRR
jgi:hypothetical protein